MGKKNQSAGVGSREERHKLKGEEAYLKLKNSILSPEGKDIVAADPDLSPVTLNKLIALQKGNLKEIQFYFGQQQYGGNIDVGCALLSICIKENIMATWAELVGRYADARNQPFLEIALGLKEYDRQYGLFYYNKEQIPTPWAPSPFFQTPNGRMNELFHADELYIPGEESIIRDIDTDLDMQRWR